MTEAQGYRVSNAHIHVAREARQHGIGVLGTVDHNGSRC